jgi:hypothetical protein
MVITITSLKLRHWWGFFRLSLRGLKILRQTRSQKGFIEMKNTGLGYLHFTLSAWESEADAKNFARSGAHLEALKESRRLATEIAIYTFRGERLPDWKAAKRLLAEHGRVIAFAGRGNSEAPEGGAEKTI